jgi:hypothetical protein
MSNGKVSMSLGRTRRSARRRMVRGAEARGSDRMSSHTS